MDSPLAGSKKCRRLVSTASSSGRPDLADRAGQEVIFGLRPDAFREAAGVATFDAVAVTVESLGDEKNVLFVPPFDQRGVDASRGEDEIAPLWTARFDPDVVVRPGDKLVLRPDLSELYFFDPVTTAALPAAHPAATPVAA